MSNTITIEAKVLGHPRKLFSDWSIPVPPEAARDGGRITLRELITWTVIEEVTAFQQRQEKRRLEQVLSRAEIQQAAEQGKIDMGGRDHQQEVDPASAIAVALQAFADGIYFVFVDGVQYTQMDDVIPLKADSHVLFLRLVALVGG